MFMSSEKSTAVAGELSGVMSLAGIGPTAREGLPLKSIKEDSSNSKKVLLVVVPILSSVLIATKLSLPKATDIIRKTPLACEPVASNNSLSPRLTTAAPVPLVRL